MTPAPLASYRVLELAHLVAGPLCGIKEQHPRAGRFRTVDTAVRLEKTPGTRRTGAPSIGEHTDVVLGEAGLSSEEIARLRSAKITL